MGADIYIRRPKNLDVKQLQLDCELVPINVRIQRGWIHFHYGYWGAQHHLNCERFVADFTRKHKLKPGKWGY